MISSRTLHVPRISFAYMLVFMTMSSLAAQTSGSGQISGYQIFCGNGQPDCMDLSNPDDSITLAVKKEGSVEIMLSITPEAVACCNASFDQLMFGEVQRLPSQQILANVNVNSPMITTTIDCLAPGDTLLFIFAGGKGTYNYTYTEIPNSYFNDIEPNNVQNDYILIAENSHEEGHIGFGVNIPDLFDWYKIKASSDGNIKVYFEHDAGMNYAAINTNTNLVINQKLKPNADTDSLFIPCVAKNDEFFIRVQKRSNICAGYQFVYITESVGPQDPDNNDNTMNATSVLNIPGQIEGTIGYGYYGNQDNADYFYLGTMEQGDKPSFEFTVGPNSLNADLLRINGGFQLTEFNFGNIFLPANQEVTISQSNDYYLRISKFSICSNYTISIDGTLSNHLIDGVNAGLLRQTSGSITSSNTTLTSNSKLCSPCVLILPIFTCPLGIELEISPDCSIP